MYVRDVIRASVLPTVVAVAVLGVSNAVVAQTIRVGDIEVVNAWARASVPNATNGAAYVTLATVGARPDRLQSLSTPVAGRAEVHTHRMQDGVMKMHRLDNLEVVPAR